MRRLLPLVVLALCAPPLLAQDFEGTITWSIRSKIVDPALRDKIFGAEKSISSSFARELTLKMKAGTGLAIVQGGPGAGEMLTNLQGDSYGIERSSGSAVFIPAGTPTFAPNVFVTTTGKTATILGLPAREHLISHEPGGQPKFIVWSTTALKGTDSRYILRAVVVRGGSLSFIAPIEGIPLKIEIRHSGLVTTIEALRIVHEAHPPALFRANVKLGDRTPFP